MPEHSYRIYKKAKEKGLPAQIYYHQNGHGGEPPLTMMNRWFTRYLHGVENEVEKDAKAWIVRENDDKKNPTPYEDYPNPAATPVTLYLQGGAPERGGLSLEKKTGQGIETLVDNFSFSGATLAKAEHTHHRLLYVTPTLSKDIHLSGTPKVSISLASNKVAANLSVWLVSLPWNDQKTAKITDNIITRGWADPQNHSSLSQSEPLVPGQYYQVTFDLMPDDQVIPKGQQIALMIFSSDREFTLWPDPGTELSVELDKTSLTIPVVGGVTNWNKAVKSNE
jgi:X-Pro dipeptidyl-peptidase